MRIHLTRLVLWLSALAVPSMVFTQLRGEPVAQYAQESAAPEPSPVHSLSGTWAAREPAGEARKSVWGDGDGGWWNYALRPDELPMTVWALEKFKANRPSFGPNKDENSNDLAYGCFPPGVPRVYASIAAGMQIIEQPGRTLMLFGENVRQIHTDGRNHPKNQHPTWMGDSIGKWEGDNFVVDTVGIDERTWIDRMGHPHSDALHVRESFHRSSYNTLELQIIVDDSKAYTSPWAAQKIFQLRPAASVRAGGGACEDMFLNEAFGLKPIMPSR